MRRIILSLAALAALTLVVPYAAPAKADTVVIHKGHDGRHHHHHHHDVVVVHHHHDY
jgi:hypothetical protein